MSTNTEYFDKIYAKYYDHVYRKVKSTLYTKVEDDITSCVQDTYIKAWLNIENLKNHANVKGWLIVAAGHTAGNFNKKHMIRKARTGDPNAIDVIPDEDFTEEIYGKIAAEEILSQLSEGERVLYEMKYVEKLSNQEIGAILGITANAVAARNNRLIKKLKELVGSASLWQCLINYIL